MAADRDRRDRARWESVGMGMIAPEDGLKALEQLVQQQGCQVAVASIDWSKLLIRPVVSPFLTDFKPPETFSPGRSLFREQLDEASVGERHCMLVTRIQMQLADVLGLNGSEPIDVDQEFFELGLDSLMFLDLKNRLESDLDVLLPATLAFEHPTIRGVVDHLSKNMLGWEPSDSPGADSITSDPSAAPISKIARDLEPEELLGQIDQLSDGEVDSLLRQALDDEGQSDE